MKQIKLHFIFLFLLTTLGVVSLAQDNVNTIGSFEQELPAYWTKGSEPSGSSLSWAKDEFMSMGRSLKINKSATSEAAMWESENMVDLWSERHFKDVDIQMGFSYKTMDVNTNPSNDDSKWFASYTFYREDGSVIGEWKKEIDQSVASSAGWITEETTVGEISLPEDSYKTIVRVVGGKDAVGTVWTDNFVFTGRDGWVGQIWNTQVGVPTGWFYWLPPNGGNDGQLTKGYENTIITDETAYQGLYSLKFKDLEGLGDGFVGTVKYSTAGYNPGDKMRITVWIKGENLQPDSAITAGDQWSVSLTPIFHDREGNTNGWGQIWASDMPFVFPNATSFDWMPFYKDVEVVEGATSISVRLHPLGKFQGTVWMDNLTVEKLEAPELNEIGSFEQELPAYWTKGSEPSGSSLSWAKDEFMSMGRSLKINKSATSEAAMWESENMVDLWSERHFKDVDIQMGFSYKTMDVNTNPSNDDSKWFASYTFYREDGSVIGEWKKEIDQSVASSAGWITEETTVGEISLPEDSYKTIVRVVGGKDAVGTVWTDNFVFTGRDGWVGQIWNTQVGVPTGWFYWLPPNGGNDGQLTKGYENTIITDETAYQGLYSLKFKDLEGLGDGFVGTRKYPIGMAVPGAAPLKAVEYSTDMMDVSSLQNVKVGDIIRISVWIKGENLHPDSVVAVGDQWSVALTPIFHNTLGNNAGWGEFWASDMPFVFPNATSFDWMPFYKDIEVVEGATSISVRLHPLNQFQGTVWMDNLKISVISPTEVNGDNTIPNTFSLSQNYPNPFNPTTIIQYSIKEVSNVKLRVYDMLGREVKTLVNQQQSAGRYNIEFNAANLSSGVYFYRIEAGNFVASKKLLLLK